MLASGRPRESLVHGGDLVTGSGLGFEDVGEGEPELMDVLERWRFDRVVG
jgi:hypothetical protein